MASHRLMATMGLCSALLAIAAGVGVSAEAQTEPANWRQWLECDLSWIVSEPEHRGPNFGVKVTFRMESISGVKVVLTRESAPPNDPGAFVVATGDTDYSGVAHFFAIPPGLYRVHVNEGLLAESEEVEVEGNNSSSEEVRVEWPSNPIATRNLRGVITSWQKSAPQNRSDRKPLANVMVQLLGLRSGKLLASTYTSAEGYYEFPDVRDGLYVVRVSETQGLSPRAYDKAVEVTTRAIRENMSGLEVDNVCGGGLSELNETGSGASSVGVDDANSVR